MRQDELNREEIWQDVIRCNTDNHFFQEPSTQKKLLDILFIYSKLNPDTGYRQGMHELLAPVLWVVYQDCILIETIPAKKRGEEGVDFMSEVLDSKYVEHDTFNLFCAIMQTAKTFYEMGEGHDSSAIVKQSERIHKELLGAVDPDLSVHLEVIGIVPQIFAIRWLRLLFGRELEFRDVLKLWDVLFAENLHLEIIDMACVAILLRLRWTLIDADYTTAITSLTRLNLPKEGDSARAIVTDAIELARRKTKEAGADITQRRTGRRQYTNPLGTEELVQRASTPQARTHHRLKSQHQASPSPSPARFVTPQKQLESLFSNVSNTFQKNAEGWSVQNVSKAVRGAVGEAKKNFEQMQGSHSRNASLDAPRSSAESDPRTSGINHELVLRLKQLEERNQALAKMLEGAQETLRKWKSNNPQPGLQGEDVFNTALAKIQFVSVYLSDSDIPIPERSPVVEKQALIEPPAPLSEKASEPAPTQVSGYAHKDERSSKESAEAVATADGRLSKAPEREVKPSTPRNTSVSPTRKGPIRPTLAESSFSFMLGENRHRTSFVHSKPTPEERRSSVAQTEKQRKNSIDSNSGQKPFGKDKKERKPGSKLAKPEDDGFTMSSFQ